MEDELAAQKAAVKKIARAFRRVWPDLAYGVTHDELGESLRAEMNAALGRATARSGAPDQPHWRILPEDLDGHENLFMGDVISNACLRCRDKHGFHPGVKRGDEYFALYRTDNKGEAVGAPLTAQELDTLAGVVEAELQEQAQSRAENLRRMQNRGDKGGGAGRSGRR